MTKKSKKPKRTETLKVHPNERVHLAVLTELSYQKILENSDKKKYEKQIDFL